MVASDFLIAGNVFRNHLYYASILPWQDYHLYENIPAVRIIHDLFHFSAGHQQSMIRLPVPHQTQIKGQAFISCNDFPWQVHNGLLSIISAKKHTDPIDVKS